MQLRKLAIILVSIMIIIASAIYLTLNFWPAAIIPAPPTPVLPQQAQEQPQYLFSLSGSGLGKLNQPISVVTDKNGLIYVTDAGDSMVKIFLPNGKFYKSFGKKGGDNNSFGYPYGIGLLNNGDILVADSVNLNVRVFSKDGGYKKTLLGSNQKVRPGALSIDIKGQIYVSDLLNHQIVVLNQEGKILRKIKPNLSSLKYPQEIVLQPNTGAIWVADSGNFAIKEINSKGQVNTTINSWGNPPQRFPLVRGMGIDSLNRLMVADTQNGTIRVMSLTGQELFSFDGKGSPVGSFVYPSFIYIDRTGNIFVTDRGTGFVQIWGYKGRS